MNEKVKVIILKSLMKRSDGWGAEEGMEVANKLIKEVEASVGYIIFNISLEGIEKNDASFARESVVAVAKRYRGNKGFYLSNIISSNLLVNWESGAILFEQPINIVTDNELQTVGPDVSPSNQLILDYVNKHSEVTASELSKKLDLQLTNASTKLNNLKERGYILREGIMSPSGGKEFNYISIS